MDANEYVKLAMRTNDGKCSGKCVKAITQTMKSDGSVYDNFIDFGGVLNACLGLSGEIGEVTELIKKYIFHEKRFDDIHLKKEIGDVMWYIALLCSSLRYDLDEIMQMNIDKLQACYPDGFDVIRANNRVEGDI